MTNSTTDVAIIMGSDSDLDLVGDYCDAAVKNDAALSSLISGILPSGFDYPVEGDDAYNDLQLFFNVTY